MKISAFQVPTAAILWGLAGTPSLHKHQQLNGELDHQAGLPDPVMPSVAGPERKRCQENPFGTERL